MHENNSVGPGFPHLKEKTVHGTPLLPFARYHTNQGLVLFLLELAIGVVTSIFTFIPVIGPIIGGLLSAVGGIFTLVLMIMGIINAAQGQAKELPLIGKFTLLK